MTSWYTAAVRVKKFKPHPGGFSGVADRAEGAMTVPVGRDDHRTEEGDTMTQLKITMPLVRWFSGRRVHDQPHKLDVLKIVAAVAVLLTALAYPGVAHADELFKATLTGDQEVPPVTTATTGKVLLMLNQ